MKVCTAVLVAILASTPASAQSFQFQNQQQPVIQNQQQPVIQNQQQPVIQNQQGPVIQNQQQPFIQNQQQPVIQRQGIDPPPNQERLTNQQLARQKSDLLLYSHRCFYRSFNVIWADIEKAHPQSFTNWSGPFKMTPIS